MGSCKEKNTSGKKPYSRDVIFLCVEKSFLCKKTYIKNVKKHTLTLNLRFKYMPYVNAFLGTDDAQISGRITEIDFKPLLMANWKKLNGENYNKKS